ncbi:hypothetical protein DRQ25_09845 [Candidatus Fermentibacteria bacterium]|nr:MAG: hypothetical protein DRQ25_09845 [Candidatus Fermentibacteria bacterium]
MDNSEQGSGMAFEEASKRFMDVFDEPDSIVQPVGVKLILKGQDIPKGTRAPEEYQGVPWCEAVRIASMDGEVVVINKGNVGCPAAGIALGLVDQYQEEPLSGMRKYTDMMETAASPADFTNGIVYGCRASDNMQFALFGEGDTGRYETLGTAQNAVAGMTSIQPDIMDAAVAYPAGGLDIAPDVIILGLLPKQALRAIQGYNFLTGNRFLMSTIGIRGVCADLTALPFLEQRLNGSFFCLGARAVGGWEGDLLGLGMPLSAFERMVTGMEKSAGGFPYKAYP